jgi:hypothetical protein
VQWLLQDGKKKDTRTVKKVALGRLHSPSHHDGATLHDVFDFTRTNERRVDDRTGMRAARSFCQVEALRGR